MHGLRGAVDLGSELATALGDLLGELSHVRVPRLEDLAELLVLALESGQVFPELQNERVLENCWQRTDVLGVALGEQALFGDALAAGLEPPIGEQRELLGDQVLGLAGLVAAGNEEDVVGLEEAVELSLRLPEPVARLVELRGQELRGIARGLHLLVQLLGDEGIGERVRHSRREVGEVALERYPDEPRAPDRLDGEPAEDGARQR